MSSGHWLSGTALAPAKINLHLAVGKKRNDGFHDLESIFVRLPSLSDVIELSCRKAEKASCVVLGLEGLCPAGTDTLTKTVRLWCKRSGIALETRVSITKHIPVKSGLGGGSADAAALLSLLDSFFPESHLMKNDLLALALEIGSDVPFFLWDVPVAYVTGRGENVIPVETMLDGCFLLAMPDHGIVTEHAFSLLDVLPRAGFLGKDRLVAALSAPFSLWDGLFRNDFCMVSGQVALQQFRDAVARVGLDGYVSMSGSGSCCYAFMGSQVPERKEKIELIKESLSSFTFFCCKM